MDKAQLLETILLELKTVHKIAVDAAQRAYDTATAEENEAENKYDTLGLEASYLAHGQAKRVAECEADVIAFEKIPLLNFTNDMPLAHGAFICLQGEQSKEQYVFLSPVSGGLKIDFNKTEITLITLSSPLGQSIKSRFVGDEVEVVMAGDKKHYEITAVY